MYVLQTTNGHYRALVETVSSKRIREYWLSLCSLIFKPGYAGGIR